MYAKRLSEGQYLEHVSARAWRIPTATAAAEVNHTLRAQVPKLDVFTRSQAHGLRMQNAEAADTSYLRTLDIEDYIHCK